MKRESRAQVFGQRMKFFRPSKKACSPGVFIEIFVDVYYNALISILKLLRANIFSIRYYFP